MNLTEDYHYRRGRGRGYYRTTRYYDGTFLSVERIGDYKPYIPSLTSHADSKVKPRNLRAKIFKLLFLISILLNILFFSGTL